jgi:predicted PurR-regulated permease PerM
MSRRRLLVVVASMVALVATAAPAGAAAPPLKAQFAPLNAQIKNIGNDIGTAINGANNATDVQLAKQFSGLAQRAAASAGNVGKLKGAKGANAITQRELQLALAQGAIDLARIAVAAGAHNAKSATAATLALIKDSPPITAARTKLARALGIRP